MKSSQNITPAFLYFILPEIGLKFDAPENPALWTDTQRSICQKKNSEDLLAYLKISQKKYFEGETDHPEVIEDVKEKFRSILLNYNDNLQNTFKKRDCFSKYCALCDWYKEVDKIISQLSKSSNYIIFTNSILDSVRGEVLLEKSRLYNNSSYADYIFESKIERIYKKSPTLFPNRAEERLFKTLKKYIGNGIKDCIGVDAYKLSIFRIIEAYRVIYSSISGISILLGSFDFDFNRRVWNVVLDFEDQILTEEKNRLTLGLAARQKRSPRAKKIESYIKPEYDNKKVITCLKSLIKGCKGKSVAIVISAAYKAGLTNTERIPYATLRRTFGEIGAESGYNYYFNEGILSDEDVSIVKEKLLSKFSVK